MDVTWLGHGCFRLRGKSASVITDPYPPSLGPKLPKLEADLITVSHDHENHAYVQAVSGNPYVVQGPGEYEVAGITVLGWPTFHDRVQGSDLGRNTVYLLEVDDVRVCHLGDLGHKLRDQDIEILGTIDILLVPVGGGKSLDATAAAEVVRQLEARYVVPMHYALPSVKKDLEPVERFLKEMGVQAPEALGRLSVQASSSGDADTKVVVLEAKA